MTKQYHQLIFESLTAYMKSLTDVPDVACHLVADKERGHYMLMQTGWHAAQRICSVTLYLRVEAGKVWIERDETFTEYADNLHQVGIPKSDIVLAYHHPSIRLLTQYHDGSKD